MEEIEALKNNNTWTLVPLPKEMNIVRCKWVFSIKYKANGSIERSKTRLATKRYTHIYMAWIIINVLTNGKIE